MKNREIYEEVINAAKKLIDAHESLNVDVTYYGDNGEEVFFVIDASRGGLTKLHSEYISEKVADAELPARLQGFRYEVEQDLLRTQLEKVQSENEALKAKLEVMANQQPQGKPAEECETENAA